MIPSLKNTHKEHLTFLTTSSIPNYSDYRAGASLLFLFPYYIQVGLAQIFYTLESVIVEDFSLPNQNLIHTNRLLQQTYNLLELPIPPITTSLLTPKLNLSKYNTVFGYKLDKDIFFKSTNINLNSFGILGFNPLVSTQQELLPRERLERFFSEVDFQLPEVDKYIDIAVNNNRVEAALIFCQYFNYPTTGTQQVINNVESWLLNN